MRPLSRGRPPVRGGFRGRATHPVARWSSPEDGTGPGPAAQLEGTPPGRVHPVVEVSLWGRWDLNPRRADYESAALTG